MAPLNAPDIAVAICTDPEITPSGTGVTAYSNVSILSCSEWLVAENAPEMADLCAKDPVASAVTIDIAAPSPFANSPFSVCSSFWYVSCIRCPDKLSRAIYVTLFFI